MPALSYKGRFVDMVEAGLQHPRIKGKRIKRQTIRNYRKYPIKEGDILYHYYGQRSKFSRKLGESICKSVHTIVIRKRFIDIYNIAGHAILRLKGGMKLNEFARADGFESWDEMRKWWVVTHGADCFPFTGQLIKW